MKDLFADLPEISKREPFLLLLRLIEEQITITEDDELKVEIKDEHKGSALSNPHDPEAQYNRHKKTAGVKMTISENRFDGLRKVFSPGGGTSPGNDLDP
ncbi:MAG: hypothetical protein ACLFT8_01845 [Desulfovermiculus sp.]